MSFTHSSEKLIKEFIGEFENYCKKNLNTHKEEQIAY